MGLGYILRNIFYNVYLTNVTRIVSVIRIHTSFEYPFNIIYPTEVLNIVC